jgi:hypothetical protein
MKHLLALTLLAVSSLACSNLSLFTPTPYPCPQATSEIFYVEPIPATTDESTITLHVTLGNLEEITVITESGTYTSTTGDVEVTLLPESTNHFEVRGKVKQTGPAGGCQYGGYTLTTTNDRTGNPLVIEQTEATVGEPDPGPSPTFCPQATPELFYVESIPTTTTDASIIVTVFIGNGEEVTVETEGGVSTVTGDFGYGSSAVIEVPLVPNSVNHLNVTARVKRFGAEGECQYGGYTLTATTDRDGNSLEVEQRSP